jgi:hypothetical protein
VFVTIFSGVHSTLLEQTTDGKPVVSTARNVRRARISSFLLPVISGGMYMENLLTNQGSDCPEGAVRKGGESKGSFEGKSELFLCPLIF